MADLRWKIVLAAAIGDYQGIPNSLQTPTSLKCEDNGWLGRAKCTVVSRSSF